jgi:hypothetical protein
LRHLAVSIEFDVRDMFHRSRDKGRTLAVLQASRAPFRGRRVLQQTSAVLNADYFVGVASAKADSAECEFYYFTLAY